MIKASILYSLAEMVEAEVFDYVVLGTPLESDAV